MPSRPDLRCFQLCWALLLPLYLLPLALSRFLPGLDLPFHLAIADMLRKAGPASPYALYEGHLGVAPYAVHYGLLHLLGLVLPLNVAHKIIMAVYVAGMPLALGRLLGACGRSRLPALLGFPLAYNMSVHYGFISFALSVPVLLWLLAETAALTAPKDDDDDDEPGSPLWGAARVAAVALLLFFCHLQNFVFGVGGALGFILLCGAPLRRRLLAAAALLPSLGLLAAWQLGSRFETAARSDLGYALRLIWRTRKSNVETTVPADLWARTEVFPQHLLKGFTDRHDQIAAAAILGAIALYIVVGVALRLARRPGERSPARLRLAGLGALCLGLGLYYGMPHHLREFELMTFYPRFAGCVAALLCLLVPGWLLRCPPRWLPLLALPALLPSLGHGFELCRHYLDFGRETADFAAVLDKTPPGGRVLGLVYARPSRVFSNESLLVGLPSYYPVERAAPSSMVPLTYCGMRHMPCRLRNPVDKPPDPGAWSPGNLETQRALGYFDYFFVRSGPSVERIFGRRAADVEELARAGTWVVYRRRGSSP